MLRALAQRARLASSAPTAALLPRWPSTLPRPLRAPLSTVASTAGRSSAPPVGIAAAVARIGGEPASRRSSDGLKRFSPATPGTRHRVIIDKSHLWPGPPLKALTVGLVKSGGRNNIGQVSTWHRGGGNVRKYRVIDFKRNGRLDEPAVVERLEYDPNRSAHIALIRYASDQLPAYILAPAGLRVGATVVSATDGAAVSVAIQPGNCLSLRALPTGVLVHNLEIHPGRGGQLVRSAGGSATVLAHIDDSYALVRLPSGETRKLRANCRATIGSLSNSVWKDRVLGKAGANRWRGIRPTTRGMAMNPCDHPHGGGNGKKKGRVSCTPWGWPTKNGYKTRTSKKYSDRLIVTRRPPGVRMKPRK